MHVQDETIKRRNIGEFVDFTWLIRFIIAIGCTILCPNSTAESAFNVTTQTTNGITTYNSTHRERSASCRLSSRKPKLIEDNLALFELDEKGTAITIAQADNAPSNSCVLFFYDLNSNGCIGEKYTKNTCVNGVKNVAKNIEKELFGYKLNGKMIETKQTYKNAVNADCRSEECQRALTQSTCNAGGGWTDLLDEKEFEISQLRFDWLKAGKGIEIKLAGNLATHKHIQYETSLVVPLLNQEE